MLARWLARLTASTFTQICQYVSSHCNRVYRYTELTISSLVMAVSIASTHCAYA